ncbi:MAG: hypothetical protein ABSB54_07935 [Acidimicrobiales bacterium]|jgi:hypothetical protein
MEKRIDVDETAKSLADVRGRQVELVDAVLVPDWYWWFLAVLSLLLGAAVDTRHPGVVAAAAACYGVIVAGVTVWMILGRGRAQLSRQLIGARESAMIMCFVWLVVGATIASALGLRAAGVAHPALLGCTVCALALVAGGQALTWSLRRSMLSRGLDGR